MEYGVGQGSIRLRRLGALFIDVSPLLCIAAIIPLVGPLAYVGAIPLVIAYRMCFAALGRDTFGKSLLSLTIISRGDKRPSRTRVLVRDLPYLAIWVAATVTGFVISFDSNATAFDEVRPALIMLILMNVAFWDLVVATVSGRYSLHDLLAGTQVVDARLSSVAFPRQPASP